MTAQAVATALGSLIGAGGQVGGGLLTNTGGGNTTGGITQFTDPLGSAISSDVLLQLGLFDPAVLRASSPFNRALSQFSQLPQGKGRRRKDIQRTSEVLGFLQDPTGAEAQRRRDLATLVEVFEKGEGAEILDLPSEVLNRLGIDSQIITDEKGRSLRGKAALKELVKQGILTTQERKFIQGRPEILEGLAFSNDEIKLLDKLAGGIGLSAPELLTQENTFQEDLRLKEEKFGPISQSVQDARLQLLQQFNQAALDIPDASATAQQTLADQLRDRNLGNLEELERQANENLLRQASAGGFNPAGGLEELSRVGLETRRDADLEALNQAIQIIGGQQALSAGGLGLLQAGLNPQPAQGSAINLAAVRAGVPATAAFGEPFGQEALGQAVAGAGGTLGSGLAAAFQQRSNNQFIQERLDQLRSQNPGSTGPGA